MSDTAIIIVATVVFIVVASAIGRFAIVAYSSGRKPMRCPACNSENVRTPPVARGTGTGTHADCRDCGEHWKPGHYWIEAEQRYEDEAKSVGAKRRANDAE